MPGYTCLCINETSVLSSRFYTGYRIILLLSLWTIPNLQNPVSSWLTFIIQGVAFYIILYKNHKISDIVRGMGKEEMFPHTVLMIRSIAK